MAADGRTGKKNRETEKLLNTSGINPTQQTRIVVKDNGKIKIIPNSQHTIPRSR
jgi:hypothetical protein